MLGRSLSYGHSFEKPVRVNDDQMAFHGYSSVGAAPNGDVYAVWLDGREEGASSETFAVYIGRFFLWRLNSSIRRRTEINA
jgi:hypothetical protein